MNEASASVTRIASAEAELGDRMPRAMAKAHREWSPLEHGPIEKLSENLWFVSGALPNMSLRRTMVVVRLPDGELVLHNGIALEDAARRELEAWGKPSWLVVPNAVHRLDAPAYKARYPELRVLAPSGSRAKIEDVVHVDHVYEEFPVGDGTVRFETLHGVREREGAMLVRSSDGTTVVLNDAMFNMDRKKDLLGNLITSVLGSAPGPRVSRLAKLIFVVDKTALRRDFERYAAIDDLTRVIVAHEKVARGAEAKAALLSAASYL